MAMFREKDYARLRAKLHIDQRQLGEELIEFPQLLLEVCEITVEAVGRKDDADAAYKIAVAVAAAELRDALVNGKKRTETEIAACAPMDEAARAAAVDAADAKADLSYWSALGESMRAKQSSMKRLSDLTVSGYISTGSAYGPRGEPAAETDARRAELAEARRAHPPQRRPISAGS